MAKPNFLKNKRILITCGPTWVAIDPMRILSNRSTGTLGHLLTAELIAKKAKVTLIEGPVEKSFPNMRQVKKIKYHFFDELETIIKEESKKSYHAVIHAAAIADFQLETPFKTKINSAKSLTLHLTKTKKLITLFKKINPALFLVGFKLESKLVKKALVNLAQDLYNTARCDLILANEADENHYNGFILLPDGKLIDQGQSRPVIAKKLVSILEQLI